jgi:hypothetical protein
MSLQFSNTTTKRGLVQFYEKEIGANYGDVSGNSDRLLEFTARVCTALDEYLLLWAKNASTWQADDINHTDFQIITANIVSGQRDYTFTTDENNNRIVDVSKVLILPSATATNYEEIMPVDELNTHISDILVNTNQGVPTQYGKIGNAVLLDSIPNYNATNGIKMVVNREGSYPTSADTTKVIGVPVHHEYFYLKPAYEHARIYGLANLGELEKAVIDLEGSERLRVTGKIADFFSHREKDVRKILTGKKINYI